MKQPNAIRLLKKYLSGKASPAEEKKVEAWYEEAGQHAAGQSHAGQSYAGQPPADHQPAEPAAADNLLEVKEAIFSRLKERMDQDAKVIPLHRRPWAKIAAAAMIILAAGAGIYSLPGSPPQPAQPNVIAQTKPADIAAPETSRARIVLSTGETVLLDDAGNGIVATDGNATIKKAANGQLLYELQGDAATAAVRINTIVNPRNSKVIHLRLADGSMVWLNCESSLKFPAAFAADSRNVEISGEAYFEVAKDAARPFIVKTAGTGREVRVLGTHFNINDYNDEETASVTLLEGSVQYSNGKTSLRLQPGQQAATAPNGDLYLQKEVDVEAIMAWKNGFFNFSSLTLPEIMRQLERWYDIETAYEGKMPAKRFSGIVSRTNNISDVLKIMEMAGMKFRIEGKKVVVQ